MSIARPLTERQREALAMGPAAIRKHGKHGTRTWRIWYGMIQRCTMPHRHDYADYGGRGIKFAERWREFSAFLEDMGEAPEEMSIERIDNDGPYSMANCKWATRSEQQNNRRVCHRITFNGETLTLSEWAKRLNLVPSGLINRLNKGWPLEQALTRPSGGHTYHSRRSK